MRNLVVWSMMALSVWGFVATSRADPVAIVNGSFEQPVQPPGGYTDVTPPGWTWNGMSRRAVWDISTGWSHWFPDGAPEGDQVGALWAASLHQTLNVELLPNTTYTLQAEYTHAPGYPSEFTLELLAGGTVLGSAGGFPDVPGVFDLASVVVTIGASHPNLGEPLVIRITSTATESDFDNVSMGAVSELEDSDGDGVPNDEDNCPDDANTDQADLDEDDLGDVCDDDADGDGEFPPLDCNDLDPGIFTTAIEICTDGIDNDCDLFVDAADDGGDCDGDTVPNGFDNCPDDANPGQADLDEDGVGNVCDPDDDNDGYDDDMDNCPVVANDQSDLDDDGVGDACDADTDGDSVDDVGDLCLSTSPSDADAGVPSKRLGKNRWADVDGDGLFDTSGKNPTGRYYTIDDTAGCNCAQIIEACGYGQGHTKHGCSNSVMDWWTGSIDREGEPPYQCKD